MTSPRRPRAGRPAARRAGTARVARTTTSRVRRPALSVSTVPTARTGSPFTTRAAILALVVCTLVVSAALPVRQYLAQRAEVSAMEQQQSAARARVAELEKAKVELQDPAYVTAEARRRLHMARPGDVTYLVIPPSTAPLPATAPAAAAARAADTPWWSQVWGGVATADRAGARP